MTYLARSVGTVLGFEHPCIAPMLELKGYRNSPIAFVLVAFPPAIRLNMPFGQDAEVIPELNVFSDRAS